MDAISPTGQFNEATKVKAEKILVCRYSFIPRIFVYLLISFTLYLCFAARQDFDVLPVFVVFLLLLLIPLSFVSVVVRISDSGIKISRWFGIYRREIAWTDLAAIKSLAFSQGLLLTHAQGKRVKISSHISRYGAFVETLRKARPDLFEAAKPVPASAKNSVSPSAMKGTSLGTDPKPYSATSSGVSDPQGIKTFQKSSIIKFAPFFLGIFGCLISLGTLVAAPPLGVIFIIFISILCAIQLNNPHTVIVQGDRLSAKSILKGGEWAAEQIRDIRMSYVQNRYGMRRNFIHVEIAGGKALRLYGFTGGDEMMYGFLKNWWNGYRDK